MLRSILIAVSMLIATPSLAGQDLLAPVYPGAVKDPRYCQMKSDPNCPEVYYSRDPAEKVIAFYRGKSIDVKKPDGHFPLEFRAGGDVVDVAVIYDSGQVYKMLNIKGELGERAAVLTVEHNNKPGPGCPEEPFQDGRNIMAASAGVTQAQFDAACKKHEHLQWALYPYSEKMGSNGMFITADRAAWQTENQALGEALMQSAGGGDPYKSKISRIERKIKRKQRRGDDAAVAELTKELNSLRAEQSKWAASGGGDRDPVGSAMWKQYLENLERLEAVAYETVIIIDRHPRTWKVR